MTPSCHSTTTPVDYASTKTSSDIIGQTECIISRFKSVSSSCGTLWPGYFLESILGNHLATIIRRWAIAHNGRLKDIPAEHELWRGCCRELDYAIHTCTDYQTVCRWAECTQSQSSWQTCHRTRLYRCNCPRQVIIAWVWLKFSVVIHEISRRE